MHAYLRVNLSLDGDAYRPIELPTCAALIGSGRAADLRIADSRVAPDHLRVFRDGDAVVVVASAAGVRVDGHELAVEEERSCAGKTIEIGPVRLVVEPWDSDEDLGDDRSEDLTLELVRDLLRDEPRGPSRLAPALTVRAGPATGDGGRVIDATARFRARGSAGKNGAG